MTDSSQLNPEDRQRIASLFSKLDVDKDGRVSVSELASIIRTEPRQAAVGHEAAKRVVGYGKSINTTEAQQTMSFQEFVDYVRDTETQLKLAFRQVDRNKDSRVDIQEIQTAMRELGIEVGEKEAARLLRKMDKDGSLSIDYEEWRDFLLLSGSSNIKDIFHYWRRASAVDIGEGILVPDDFTEEERKSGEAWKTLVAGVDKLNEADRERIASLFKKLDVDKDGRVSVTELAAVIKSQWSEPAGGTSGVEAAKRIITRDGKQSASGPAAPTMSFQEFVEYVRDTETQLKLAFKQLDRNKDNQVDVSEIRAAMRELGIEVGEKEAARLLRKMDKDGSLSIDYEEWRDFLLLSGSSNIKDIFHYWRRASAVDIGEGILVPDDFTEEERKSGEAWKTLLAGGIAGCISRTATAPLDRVKVIWQARGGKAASTGLIGSFRTMLREGGYASMWRGNGVNCIKIAPESAIKFQAYEFFKSIIRGDRRDPSVALHEKFLAGAMAGATAQTLIYPMEVLKTRMCLRKTGQYSSMFDCARKLYAEHGIGIFYRGYVPNLIGILPYAGIDLALYETFKNAYVKSVGPTAEAGAPPVFVSLTAGALSSVCGQVATYPLALVRTKLQAQSEKSSMEKMFKSILKNEGFAGLYRGIGPNMLKVIPAVSISYACYEQCRGLFGI